MTVSRRRFLKRTMGAAAACGWARWSTANNDLSSESITDTHVYVGHWPHKQLSENDPVRLVAELRKAGVGQAWAGSFDGLFHKDVAGVNQRLAEECARVSDGMLIPIGTINPTLPDWEDDIRRCHQVFHMPGIRLHPNYHGYTLDDPRFARLLELAEARNVIVQVVAWMEAERHLLLNPRAAEVDVKPLAEKIAAFPKLKPVVTNGYRRADDEGVRSLVPLKPVYFDFGRAEKAQDVRLLIDKISSDRVVFGSGTPLHDVRTAVAKMQEANLTKRDWHLVGTGIAKGLVEATTGRQSD